MERLKLFTAEQLSCVYEFLDMVRQSPESYSYYVLIDRGKKRLEKFFAQARS